MKSLWMRVLCCLLVLAAAPALLGAFAFWLPPQYEATFLGALKYKCDALENAPGKRLVIIGGSGAAFGVRCDLLEQALPGYTAVNLGMYAGLGTTVMLELAQPLLRSGDVVIFAPEQSEQTLSDYFNAEAMWQAVDGRPELLLRLPYARLGDMLGAFPGFAAAKLRFFRDGTTPAPEGVYSRAAFNAAGDIAHADRPQNIMAGGVDPNMPIVFDELPPAEFFQVVNDFAQHCRAQGITFFYRFCPMNQRAVADDGLDAYVAALQAQLDCPLLGEPREAMLDAAWFYDTNFHLNASGAVVHTAALARDVAAALGLALQAVPPLPEMPPLTAGQTAAEKTSTAGLFHYEALDGAVRLTGLTAEGRTQTRITIPAAIDGLPVTSFAPTLFAGNRQVREIILPDSITRIENGSFDGCTALERIELHQPSPEKCSVGEQLLQGTQSRIYVPQACVGAYMTNYFWSVHAARIVAADIPVTAGATSPSPTPQRAEAARRVIVYHANGGQRKSGGGDTLAQPVSDVHLRANTAQGTRFFVREGYVLTGWNSLPDGSGVPVGLGSRTDCSEGMTLHAQWARENPAEDFSWSVQRREVHITGYHGSGADCVVPAQIDGLPVTRICSGAFRGAALDTLVLPPSVVVVERLAFESCSVREITLFDGLYSVYDESFAGCDQLTTLRVQAMLSPAYSSSYFAAFADKYDWLLSIAQEKKIVLASGSSGRYGYDSLLLREAFPAFNVANMGVYAYTNALPQLELIRQLMQPGDILLSAPEFDTVNNQFCTTNELDAHFWAMMEANYDAAALLDLRQFDNVFDSLCSFLTSRTSMGSQDYAVSPAWFDDDGHPVDEPTYNQYGDYTLLRPNSPQDELLQWGLADYTTAAFPLDVLQGMNEVYRRFLDDGVTVYFTYTPRNIRAITPESTPEARAALHAHLAQQLCVPVISPIEESLYPGTLFYLIDSHLSTEGVRIRTERIIDDLRAQME